MVTFSILYDIIRLMWLFNVGFSAFLHGLDDLKIAKA